MFSRILYATDFSANATCALDYVKKLKEAGAKEIIIVHVYDQKKVNAMMEFKQKMAGEFSQSIEDEVFEELLDSSLKKLKKIEKELKDLGFSTHVEIKIGYPGRGICKFAEQYEPCVIVIGAQGESHSEDRALGSTAMHVVNSIDIPVFLIKMQKDECNH